MGRHEVAMLGRQAATGAGRGRGAAAAGSRPPPSRLLAAVLMRNSLKRPARAIMGSLALRRSVPY